MTEPENPAPDTEAKSEKHYRIQTIEVRNVMRMKYAYVVPKGNVITIGGRNKQGKSSFLRSIFMGVGGKGALPSKPIRDGQGKAEVTLDLGEYKIELVIDERDRKLVVRGPDGKSLTSPQKILDALCAGKLAFEPLEFVLMDDKKQDALLRQAAGLDFTDLDADYKVIYERRTELNRTLKSIKGQFDAAKRHADAPAEEKSVAELSAELKARQDAERKVENDLRIYRADLDANSKAVSAAERSITELTEKLEAARKLLADHRRDLAAHEKLVATNEEALAALPKSSEIQEQLSTVDEANRKVRANAEYDRLKREVDTTEAAIAKSTRALEGIEVQKQERLAEAKFPVKGLGFNDVGPTLDGKGLDVASQAQLIELSVAIALAQNPKLRVFIIREGSLMDDDAMLVLAQLAEKHDMQVWVEIVSKDGEGCDFFIEDGEIVETDAAE